MPGVSMKMTWAGGHAADSSGCSGAGRVKMPSSWLRVVCGLGLTIAIFWPR